jgi:hypothetical protein
MEPGGALYAAATAAFERTTLTLEGKDYRNFRPWQATMDPTQRPPSWMNTVQPTLVYQQPPTLERVQVPFLAGTDMSAARLQATWQALDVLGTKASFMAGQDRTTPLTPLLYWDAWAALDFQPNEGATRLAPLVEHRRSTDPSGSLVEAFTSLELAASQRVSGPWSVEATTAIWLRDKPGVPDAWTEGYVQAGVHLARTGLVGVGYEFTTENLQQRNQHQFVNAQLKWEFAPGASVAIFAGGQRPGLRCASGLCRVYPAFQGLRGEIVVSY